MKTATECCLNFLLALLFSSFVFGCGSSSDDDSNKSQPENRPPTAKIENFSANQGQISAFENQAYTLNATGSIDLDSDELSFQWQITAPSGSESSFIDNSAPSVIFKPDVTGDYSVQLTVSDTSESDSITLLFNVQENTPPIANPGSDQVVSINDTVMLSSANSTDADGHTLSSFEWVFKTKPENSNAIITGADATSASFTLDVAGTYVVELTVTDELGQSGTEVVTISTKNVAPVACTRANITDKKVSDIAILDGSCSSDIDGDKLTYKWMFKTKPEGSASELDDATAVKPSFQIDKKGEYVLSLIVNDGEIDSTPKEQRVNAVNSPPTANAG